MKKGLGFLVSLAMLVGALAAPAGAGGPWYVSTTGNDTNDCLSEATACATIQGAIGKASAGDTIYVASGTYTLSSTVNVNKANLTIAGAGSATTIHQVSASVGYAFNITANGVTLRDLQIEKTDKTTQNLILINADDVTINDNLIWGQYVMGDADVSRAFEVAYGSTGLLIQGNTIHSLRQPGYFNGSLASPTTGNITANHVYNTRGWVMDGANMTFTDNTWGTGAQANYVDIAILSGTDASYYPDIVAISEANNNAVVEDQRPSPAVLTDVFVDAAAAAGGDGTVTRPYQTISPAIPRVVAGGTIYVAAGTYQESLGGWRDFEIFKSLSLIGAGSGSTIVELSGLQHGVEIRPDGTGNVLVEGIAFTKRAANTKSSDWAVIVGETGGTFNNLTFKDVEVAWGQARNLYLANATYNSVVLENCNIHHSGAWGFSARGTITSMAVTDSHFDNNGWDDPSHGIGFDLDMPISVSSLTVTGGTFNNNKSKGINLVNTNNATFTDITASNNSGASAGGFGVSLWEWIGTSQNLVFNNPTLTDNATDGLLIGSETGMTVSGVTITGGTITGNGRGGVFIYRAAGWGDGVIEDVTITQANISGNTQYGVGVIMPYETVMAERNWWGHATGPSHTSNPHGTGMGGDAVTDGVDFTPWYATSTTTPATEFVEVVHNPTIAWSDTIQGGVDAAVAGDTVNVAAGTYVEQVEIAKDLTLAGVGAGTIIQSPDVLTKLFVTGTNNNKPVVYIHDAADVTVEDLVVDGAGKGNANVRFIGIAYRNAGGMVDSVEVKDVRDTPFSGAQHGVALYAYADNGTDRTLEVKGTNIHDFQKNGMALNGSNLAVNVHHNTVSGYGPTTVTAQNGIQVGYGASGTVAKNSVSNVSWLGATWTASTILILDADANVTDNTVSEGQTGIYFWGGSGTLSGNSVSASAAGVGKSDFWGIIAGDPPNALPSPFSEAGGESSSRIRMLADLTMDVTNNTLTGSGSASSEGLEIAAGYDDDNVGLSATGNTISGWGYGVTVYKCTSGCGTGGFTSLAVNQNSIAGNSTYGMYVDGMTTDVDAELNWWGDATGPYHATTNTGGLGNAVTDYVDYSPWLGKTPGSTPMTYYVQPGADVAKVIQMMQPGDTLILMAGNHPGGIVINKGGIKIKGEVGAIIGPGSPAFTVTAADVVIEDLVLDGDSSTDPAILVQSGGDNLTVRNCEIREWADGIQIADSVESLKVVGNWIHDNTDAGLQVDSLVALSGVVTIEGNLFKANGGNGIQNDGTTDPLDAEHNSWGHLAGPASGDGISTKVDADPWTFAEVFMDVDPDTEAVQRSVNESESFNVALKVDAAKLLGLVFKVTYDPTRLSLNSTIWSTAFDDNCEVVGTPPAGTLNYRCTLDAEYDADGGTVATLNFTATGSGLTGNGPWDTYFDVYHSASDTNAGALGGVKIYVNNAGYGSPSATERDITDTDDGRIDITGIANYTGFADVQGRTNDSGAVVQVFNQATKTGATLLAQGTSAAGGKYTTAYESGQLLTVGSTYWFQVDKALYLPTTPITETVYIDSHILDIRPLTSLNLVVLLGGDATNDDVVDISDASCIGSDFGQAPSVCGADGWSDVNGDGIVDILDLVLMGGNFGLISSPWTP